MAMILGSRVMAYVGLGVLESEGHSCEPHPIVGGAVCSSHRAISGWWSLLTFLNVATRFVSPTTTLEILFDISYAQVENSASAQNITVAFHPGVL